MVLRASVPRSIVLAVTILDDGYSFLINENCGNEMDWSDAKKVSTLMRY